MFRESAEFILVRLVCKPRCNAFGNLRPHVGHVEQVFGRSCRQRFNSIKGLGELFGDGFTHVSDSEGKKDPLVGHVRARFKTCKCVGHRLFFELIESAPAFRPQIVEVGRRVNPAKVDEAVDGFGSDSVDVHGAPVDEVLNSALDLGRTSIAVRAEVLGLAVAAFE